MQKGRKARDGPAVAGRARPRRRDARPGDGPALQAVFLDAVTNGAAGHYSAEERRAWAGAAPSGRALEAAVLTTFARVAVARRRIVGFMTLEADGHLGFAYVAPRWMGRGVADALYADIAAEAARRGMGRLTTEASRLARPFFTRHGWQVEARQSVIREGVALTNYRMYRELGAAQE